jgi:1-acyl-sn-glycerol-3-phosphate acyltransferase
MLFYRFAKPFIKFYYKILFRVKVVGSENIPEQGAIILCSNHISNNDPLLLGAFIKRRLNCMAKAELFRIPLLGMIIRSLGAFPVNRDDPGMDSFRKGMEVLKNGKVLCIFAQGRRFREIDAKDAKAGVALFAMKSGAEVYPIKITPRYRLFRKLYIKVGPAVDISAYRGMKARSETLREAAELIINKVAEL